MKTIFISGCWPGNSKGYEFAVDSDLNYVSDLSREIHFIGPKCERLNNEFKRKYHDVKFHSVDFYREKQSVRFAKSLFMPSCPAISVRYRRGLQDVLRYIVSVVSSHNEKFIVIYEDIPCSYLLRFIKNEFKNSLHVVRSHNVVYEGFYNLSKGISYKNLAWKFELKKILRLEKKVSFDADLFYAISEDDSNVYSNLDIKPDAVWPVRFKLNEYLDMPRGDQLTVVHVGTADTRKGADLLNFVSTAWPLVMKVFPNARLVLGGKGTEMLSNADYNIVGLGFVDSDKTILQEGNIFINPQMTGSGIKIKSIIAMAAKKVLVTTPVGIEGIDANQGVHFIMASNSLSQAEAIISLFSDNDVVDLIARNASNNVLYKYSQSFSLPGFEAMYK
ncbi:glycosyltransferase [Vibrio parahaemolyticus]|uniref:glycosyltransferase n=2 Tax=Vibrio parahaemolyticus TaxID=670 RepID=UPI00038E5F01|nr:glycosyltransferase [Vibrio parahaemolyticus]RFD41217.1 hypothetical protein H328_009755 [Vibrio parahaemolyticus 3355]EGR0922718.1 glycosyltransferase [Vibrio parahaemolyticus]EGR0983786.1 glycosyltransferase [Vibrio parahaemolyticus]EGR1371745.1 glycosyltransferase [Vibrio parahaemolyticus]EGR1950286.1 glycosyltransferase [Vibrio parahaemolyticus]